ncbi:reverse transcriptase [Tanacetum coccineum]|uniref:Reverse transcriptase n=1 Tax=Tanacetum coccineum TaxID=301880 RepID=A0ABQ5BXV1_9ASTR
MVNTRTNSVTPVVTMDALQETMNEMKSALLTLTGKVNDHTLEFKMVQYGRMLKIEFPKFNGADVKGWIFRCRQFFRIDNVPEEIMVELAAMYVYDKALAWHQQLVKRYGERYTWELYEQEALKRFRAEATNNAMKPRYTSAQANYKPNSFGGGYKSTGLLPKPTTTPLALPAPTQTNNGTRLTNSPFKKQLTQKELEEKRAKNQCFCCDQRYSPGYKCNGQVYSLEVIGESEEQEEDDSEHLVESNEEDDNVEMCNVVFDNGSLETLKISLNALSGVNSFQTIRVRGMMGKQPLHILVDSGSTHNFVDIRSAKRLGCKIRPTAPLLVSVANGEEIVSNYECKPFNWSIQGQNYSCDAMLLPLGGCEMVLGVQWLSTLGDINRNFRNLTMEFKLMGKRIMLRGTKHTTLQRMQGKYVQRKSKHKEAELYSLMMGVYPASCHKTERTHDHKITPVPNTHLINIMPYRNPPSQKDAIEAMVTELLDSGVIRASQSLFSSPIVDYRQLNKYTVEDKFPVPVIEELMDELGGSVVFSKLNLRSGYHQIRMNEEDIGKTAFRIHEEHYEFLVMPFGITNAPPTFYRRALKVEYLGHVINSEEVATNASKIEAIKHWPVPSTLKQLREFLGLTGYYRRAMMEAPILGLPDFDQEFMIETDASGTRIGAVLCQKGHPLAYLSKTLATKNQGLSTYEKEFMAVKLTTPFQHKWLPKLLRYDYEIVYKKGVDNVAIDALYKGDKLTLEGGHSGVLVTTKKLNAVFYWTGLKRMVRQFVKECDVCQRQKPDLSAYHGLLQSLPIPERIWTKVSMNFIEKLPSSQGKRVIMMVVDRLSNAINTTPYEVVYGQTPPIHIPYVPGDSRVESMDRTLQSREEAINMLKFHMKRAQDRMRSQADKHRTDREFEVGNWVYLKLQPHKKVTVRQGQQHKISAKYHGPFLIEERIGKVAYKLKLPSHSKIHLVFHISQLKKCHERNQQMGSLPQLREYGLLDYKPMAILERRLGKLEDKLILKEDGVDTHQMLITFDLNEPKDSSKNDKAAQNGRTPKSLTLEIHHGGCFTLIPSRSYVGEHVSSVNVDDIDEFCLHDLKDMVVKLGYGLADLIYYHFLIPRLGLDYGLHPLNVDADVLEMAKYVKDYKIILVYVKHRSSIFVTPKKGVSIAVDNHLRKGHIEIDSIYDVNRNLTPMCHRNLTKEWEQVSSKSLSIGEVMKILSKKQPSSYVEAPIVVECADYPFEDLDEILGDYANTGKQITGNEITGKQIVVHVGNISTVDDVLDLEILFETEGVGPVVKFKEVEVDADNESEEESDIEGDYTSSSDSEDSDYDPKHDEVFDDDEHIVEYVHVSMNNFCFTADPKHDLSTGVVEVQEDDLDVIDYDSFGSDLDDRIDSERRVQLRELRRIGKHKNKGPNKYYFYLGQQFASKERVTVRVRMHSVETRRKLIMVKNDKEMVRVRCEGTIPALVPYVAIETDMSKNEFS